MDKLLFAAENPLLKVTWVSAPLVLLCPASGVGSLREAACRPCLIAAGL